MPALISTFARSTGSEKPWWGVGQEIDASESIDIWMQKTALDYTVQRRKIHMHTSKDNAAMLEVQGYHAITRSSDGHVFQVASDKYTPIQNREIASFFKVYCEAGEMELNTIGSLKDGHIVWGLAKIGSGFELAGGDKNESYLLLATAHDGSMAFTGMTTSVRVVCWNTLSAALSGDSKLFRLKHTKNADVKGVTRDAHSKLDAARKQTEELHVVAQQLSESRPSRDDLDTWLYRLTQPTMFEKTLARINERTNTTVDVTKLLDECVEETESYNLARALRNESDHNKAGREIIASIMRSPGADMESAKGTWWGAVNGVTHYADHVATADDQNDRLTSSWFGSRADMKDNAVTYALEYASNRSR